MSDIYLWFIFIPYLSLSFCYQLAQHYGYITINWNRVNHDVEKARKELQKKTEKDLPKFVDQLHRFLVENVLLAGGFAGGFFLGLASS
jgi:FUN14 domain-containing protein 1